jgi:hypothetical protein
MNGAPAGYKLYNVTVLDEAGEAMKTVTVPAKGWNHCFGVAAPILADQLTVTQFQRIDGILIRNANLPGDGTT